MSTAPPTNLETEIQQLESELEDAERARVSDADRHAQEIRQRLENKRRALQAAQETAAQGEQDRQHAMQLTALQELGAQESAAKAEVLQLQRELAQLPGRLQLAQARHSGLCRASAGLRADLGIC